MKTMNPKTCAFRLLKAALPMAIFASLALGQIAIAGSVTPMIQIGGGTDTAVGHGTSMLLRLDMSVGTGGNPCQSKDAVCQSRMSQLIIMNVSGDLSVDRSATGTYAYPRMAVTFTPVAIPINPQRQIETGDIMKYGFEKGHHFTPVRAEISKDLRLGKETSFHVSLLGFDGQMQAFPSEHWGIFVNYAAEGLGVSYLRMVDGLGGIDSAAGMRLVRTSFEMGAIFAPSESFVMRLTSGASVDHTQFGEGIAHTLIEGEVFTELRVSITRLVDVFGRAAYKALYRSDTDEAHGYVQIATGVEVKFD